MSQPLECPDCHRAIDNPQAAFCPQCGRELHIARHRPGETAPPQPKPAAPQMVPDVLPPAETQAWLRQAFGPSEDSSPLVVVSPPRRRSLRGRLSTGWMTLIFALVALIVVTGAAVAGYLVSRDGDDGVSVVTTQPAGTSLSSVPETEPTTEPPPPTESTAATEVSLADADDWPDLDGWTVIIVSLPVDDPDSKDFAQQLKQDLRGKGIEAGVLYSSGYSSLNPGYWAVFSGVFETETQAAEHRDALRDAFPESYPRQVRR